MFGIGGWELAILVLFGFLIFGPDKMPQIARTIGRAVRQFRNAQEQMNKVIKAEVYDPLKDLEPLANPFSGFSLDDTKGDAKKAGDSKKTAGSTEKAPDKPAEKTVMQPKVTGDVMQAAVAAEAEKARKAAVKATPKKTAASSTTGSFAQRRARLEKEHAQAKVAKDESPAPAAPAASATPAPAVSKTKTKPKAEAAAVKPTKAAVSSDSGEEAEKA